MDKVSKTLPEESFCGKVSTGALVHTIGTQELTRVVFTWFTVRSERVCSPVVVVLEWPWSTHLSLPSSIAAWQRLWSTLQGERKKIFNLQVRSTVCSCLQELTPGVNNSSREPHQILARCLWAFCFGHHTLYQSVLQSKTHQSPHYGL